ncbi:hypothetical protein LPB137_00330 [Poseidonibacter parvus]|uniref:Antitoxin n=1 Tax=Poseidonibacter parvus TaxID=1850254 RepID=A0A1P8KIL3_9BACT|nr:hypothetical protein [Poseidonibacter parvus]APW64385.1 hypothetical protein LPB137_00330 [Poseidonibacter parvus]
MDLLQYRSNEMFSSTELIRKSKMIFDKVSKKEIDKAVILRDGKPSFMLLDFNKYEELINDYIKLQEKVKEKNLRKPEIIKDEKEIIQEESIEEIIDDEINNKDLENALAQIENLDLDFQKKATTKKENEALKDFWE